VLYKPIYEQDRVKITEIISVFGFIYRCIAIFIASAGVILSLFLPLIFPHTSFSWGIIYLGFYAYLTASLLGYLFNYKQQLLAADQKNYLVTGYYQLIATVKTLTQMVLALTLRSFSLYLINEIIFGLIASATLEWKIRQTYPWLASEVKLGRKLFKKYAEIGTYVRQLFIHKIAGFVQYQVMPLLIYSYVSLPVVALYGNYTLITDKLRFLFYSLLDSTGAGVGNLISEGNREKIYAVYKELLAFRVYIMGFMVTCFYMLVQEFIVLWLGEDYLLSPLIPLLVSIQLFLFIVRNVNDQFINGFGLFFDVWAPVVEVILFVLISTTFGAIYGLPGMLMGPILSAFIIGYLWKPYFLFSRGFKRSVAGFWLRFGASLAVTVAAIALSITAYHSVLNHLALQAGWMTWVLHSLLFVCLFGSILTALFALLIPEFRGFAKRIRQMLPKR
jgi:O-antigen/teichoic acid export membrane protein